MNKLSSVASELISYCSQIECEFAGQQQDSVVEGQSHSSVSPIFAPPIEYQPSDPGRSLQQRNSPGLGHRMIDDRIRRKFTKELSRLGGQFYEELEAEGRRDEFRKRVKELFAAFEKHVDTDTKEKVIDDLCTVAVKRRSSLENPVNPHGSAADDDRFRSILNPNMDCITEALAFLDMEPLAQCFDPTLLDVLDRVRPIISDEADAVSIDDLIKGVRQAKRYTFQNHRFGCYVISVCHLATFRDPRDCEHWLNYNLPDLPFWVIPAVEDLVPECLRTTDQVDPSGAYDSLTLTAKQDEYSGVAVEDLPILSPAQKKILEAVKGMGAFGKEDKVFAPDIAEKVDRTNAYAFRTDLSFLRKLFLLGGEHGDKGYWLTGRGLDRVNRASLSR